MHRLGITLTLLCVTITASAGPVVVELVPIEFGFTSTLTTNPTDIWAVVVEQNDNTDPVFSLDLAIPGNFVQSRGTAIVWYPPWRSPLYDGGLIAADTFFERPASAFQNDVVVETAVDTETLLAADYTLTGDVPLINAGEIGVPIATLAVPAGFVPTLPQKLGTAAVRTPTGPVTVDVVSFIVPEPTTASLTLAALLASTRRRNRSSSFLQADL